MDPKITSITVFLNNLRHSEFVSVDCCNFTDLLVGSKSFAVLIPGLLLQFDAVVGAHGLVHLHFVELDLRVDEDVDGDAEQLQDDKLPVDFC